MMGRSFSDHRTVKKINAGGLLEVYRAHDKRLEQDVALKIPPTGTLADDTARKQSCKEALALFKLNHRQMPTVYDSDTEDEAGLLVAQHLVGATMSAEPSPLVRRPLG